MFTVALALKSYIGSGKTSNRSDVGLQHVLECSLALPIGTLQQ